MQILSQAEPVQSNRKQKPLQTSKHICHFESFNQQEVTVEATELRDTISTASKTGKCALHYHYFQALMTPS